MLQLILRRLAEGLPLLFLLASLAFFLVRVAPGGPFDEERELPEATRAAMEAQYGLDAPLLTQYGRYMGFLPSPSGNFSGLLQGNLGTSLKHPGWGVGELMAGKVGVSLQLGLLALVLSVAFGVLMGLIAALRAGSWVDRLASSTAMLGICLPSFVLGPILILVFALGLGWFPASGFTTWEHRVLPVFTLACFYTAWVARLTRTGLMEVRTKDFMRTAASKGLGPWRVMGVHGLRNAILPVVSFLGPASAGLLSGSFVVETVFYIPGLGRFFVNAAFNRDYPMVIGCALLYAVFLMLANLIAEILQAFLNPRLRKL